MKKVLFAIAAVALTLTGCNSPKANGGADETEADSLKPLAERVPTERQGKVLVAYFSAPETDGVDAVSGASRVKADGRTMGNTEYVARIISGATSATLFEIKTERTYPASHKALIDAAKEEIDAQARPKLATHIADFDSYGMVFVGFPNWWYDMPMPLYSFFDEYDFTGKTVIPFVTHGGSRFSSALDTIRSLEPEATVVNGYSVNRDNVPDAKDGIENWLKEIGIK